MARIGELNFVCVLLSMMKLILTMLYSQRNPLSTLIVQQAQLRSLQHRQSSHSVQNQLKSKSATVWAAITVGGVLSYDISNRYIEV